MFVALTAVWLQASAQIRCEQWIDNNRGSTKWTDLILGEQTFTVDGISSLSPGLHFLNVLPYDESGEKGVWRCIPFLMPEYWPGTNDATMVEYWVTGYDQQPHREPYAGTAVMLDIDASRYSPGMHFFNYRTLNERGEGGAWKQIPFYINNGIFDDELISYEYWIDEQEPITATGICPGIVNLEINMEDLSVGMHTLYFRAKSWAEIFGETYSQEFEVVEDWDAIDKISSDNKPFDVFTMDGKMVRHQVTTLKGLPKGIYIVNGRKEVVK